MGLTQAEFARLLGIDRSVVTRWKQAGRLVFGADGLVDPDLSRERIAATASPEKSAVAARHAEARGAALPPALGGDDEPEVTGSYTDARARKENAQADIAEMERDIKRGELVLKADVRNAVADVSTTFRQALENLPHRISASLVGKDLDAIRAELKQEVNAALTEMEREFARRVEQLGQEGE